MNRPHHKGNRRGQIVALAPVMLAVLGAVLALTTDVGQMLVAEARLQNAADASSLAAAQVLLAARNNGMDEEEARAAALTEAESIKQENWADAGLTLQFGYRSGESFVEADTETEATAVRATAFRNENAPGGRLNMLLAGLAGITDVDIEAPATCEVAGNIRGYYGNLSPFAVPEDQMVAPGQPMIFYGADNGEDGNGNGGHGNGNGNAHGNGGTQSTSGNWGLVNYDGGPNTTPELEDWIMNGYQGGLEIDPDDGYVWVEGSPGWRAALKDEMSARIGDELIMLIYDQVTGNGANSEYRVVGFFSATILEVEMTGNNRHLTCLVNEISGVHNILLGGAVNSTNLRKIQLVQ